MAKTRLVVHGRAGEEVLTLDIRGDEHPVLIERGGVHHVYPSQTALLWAEVDAAGEGGVTAEDLTPDLPLERRQKHLSAWSGGKPKLTKDGQTRLVRGEEGRYRRNPRYGSGEAS